ncbi:MAG TPA: hypothetical protein VIJ95_00360 [Hanamia sp.]
MEVHHHPHVEKKNFKEYFLEFIMIFLAVTMGFIAESIRESITENKVASEYSHSLVQDLKRDTADLNIEMGEMNFVSPKIDTFINLVQTKKINELPGGIWYYYGRFGTRLLRFQSRDATLQQLKSSGALRYFKNHAIINALAQYDQKISNLTNFIYFEQSVFAEKLTETRNKLFIAYYFIPVMNLGMTKQAVDYFKIQNFPLLDSSRTLMIEYANYCELKQNNDRYVLGLEKDLFANETTLLRMLEEQYNIR